MNIRNSALKWFQASYPDAQGDVYASRFYSRDESWSKSKVWFFQIPLSEVNPAKSRHLHLICENHLAGQPFIWVKVPALFILKNRSDLDIDDKGMIRLYLSAEAADMFKEVREGKLHFQQFVQAP